MFDFAKIGEVLLKAVNEANAFFLNSQLPHRFYTDESKFTDEILDMFMAKKKNGRPKEDYPPFEMTMTVKDAKVKLNRFCVLYSDQAINNEVVVQIAPAQATLEVAREVISDDVKASTLSTQTTNDAYANRGIIAPSPKRKIQEAQLEQQS